jgi:hypothetical protein
MRRLNLHLRDWDMMKYFLIILAPQLILSICMFSFNSPKPEV